MGTRRLTLALVLALAAPASASEVLHVEGDSVRAIEDPYLPARAVSDLPEPRSAEAAPTPRAAAGPSVRKVLRDALLAGRITQEQHDEWRGFYDEARSARGRLSGARRAQLHSVIATLERIAANGSLSAGRMPILFIQLKRNTAYWLEKPFPASGARLTFGDSPLIFQYYPGSGLQFQPLANFAKANALYNACEGVNTEEGTPCRRIRVKQMLDALVAVASRRGDFTTWEYFFRFGGGSPPWTSGMSQGTAIQALSRGSKLLGDPSYLEMARSALGAFERRPPTGVRVASDGGAFYLIYSFAPGLRVFNGFIQAVNGLHDYAEISGDPRGKALFEDGERAARPAIGRADTGAWTLYSQNGRESTLEYHRVLRDFVRGACTRTGASVYCDAAERFTRYLLEEPRIKFLGGGGKGRAGVVRFSLSKISRVSLRLTSGGRTAFFGKSTFAYGKRSFGFRARPGRYAVRLEAVDLRNHHYVERGSVTVRR